MKWRFRMFLFRLRRRLQMLFPSLLREDDLRLWRFDLAYHSSYRLAVRLLRKKSPSGRMLGAEALGNLGDSRAVKRLIAALGDQGQGVRQKAAEALGKLGDSRAVETLIAALGDQHADVRRAAAEALGKLGWRPENDSQRAQRAIAAEDREEAERLGSAAVEQLIQTLGNSDSHGREYAAQALGKLADARAVDPLIAALADEDGTVLEAAAVALGDVGDRRAVRPLIAALDNESVAACYDKSVRAALVKFGEAAVEPLIAALDNKGSRVGVHEGAAEALGTLADPRAVEPLIAALGNENELVVAAAARALGKLGDSRAVGPLIACLGDDPRKPKFMRRRPDFLLQYVADALGKLGDSRAVEPLIAAYAASAPRYGISEPREEMRTADSCLSALKSVLAHSLASIDANLLRRMTTLPVLTWSTSLVDYEHPSNTEYAEYSSDPHEVRQLARQELIRRGLDRHSRGR